MLNYKTQADQKLHTHYSELKRCTSPTATFQAVRERNGDDTHFDGPIVQFGRDRHEMWEQQTRQTGRVPREFHDLYDEKVDYAEHAFAVEVFKDVVLHFRPDAVSIGAKAIIDYKKIVGSAKQFHASKQLLIYAYGLWLHGIDIRERVYLCEKWERPATPKEPPTKIIGYEIWRLPITLADIGQVPMWLKERVQLLKTVDEHYKSSVMAEIKPTYTLEVDGVEELGDWEKTR